MRGLLASIALLAACVSTGASAQTATNLSGRYVCVRGCSAPAPGLPAIVTQNGTEMNLVNEAGVSSRAWVDWPGHIWAENYQQGAVFSPDGMVIQFDHGTVWQRVLPPPLPLPRLR